MTRESLEEGGTLVTFSPDNSQPDSCICGIVSWQALDEISGVALLNPVKISAQYAGLTSRTANGGIIGLTGVPNNAFPDLNDQNYQFQVTIAAKGYLTRHELVTIAKDRRAIAAPAPVSNSSTITLNSSAGLRAGQRLWAGPILNREAVVVQSLGPGTNQVTLTAPISNQLNLNDPVVIDEFKSMAMGPLRMHREPVIIKGRTVLSDAGTTKPIADVSIRLTQVWWSFQSDGCPLTAHQPNLITVSPPLYFPRPTTISVVRQHEMTVTGKSKSLVDFSGSGTEQLRVSDRVGLAPGKILWLEATDPDRMEYLEIAAVGGTSPPEQPATVTLTCPLAFDHRPGAVIRLVTRQAAGSAKNFERDAIAGDACVFLTGRAGLTHARVVEVTGGGAPAEYHRLQHFEVISDADGFFKLPPLSRVAQVEIQAVITAPHPPTAQPLRFSPDYTRRENCLDIIFRN